MWVIAMVFCYVQGLETCIAGAADPGSNRGVRSMLCVVRGQLCSLLAQAFFLRREERVSKPPSPTTPHPSFSGELKKRGIADETEP